MTNCPEVSELRRLLDGDSSAEDVGELVRHVDGCPTCLQRLDEFTRQNALPLAARAAAVCRTPESDELMAHLVRTIPAPAPLTWAHDPKEPRDPVPPAIPGFEQLELVGRGGSGQVYRAWQPSCARWVALKVLNPGRSLGRSPRVLREARFLGRLNHRHVVRILDSGAHAGQPYLVMEWISGGSLHDRLRQGPLSIQESAQLGEQVASALAAVHALGIVHRDLKPANVLLEEPGADVGGRMAKLTDFGIARDEENEERLTSTGMILGTPQYMSPEQTGLLPETSVVGPASDIYGVGAVLFACLTGQPPQEGAATLATLSRIAQIEAPRPKSLRSEIPADLETIVVKCLRRNPAQRYRSAGELAEDLRCFREGRPIAARPYTWVERLWHWGRRHPGAVTALTLTGLLLLISIRGALYHFRSREELISQLARQNQVSADRADQAARAATEAEARRNQAIDQALEASRALLAADAPSPTQLRKILEKVRAAQLAESDTPDRLTAAQAEILGGSLLNLTFVEHRNGMNDFHQEDAARILRLAQQFPESKSLRRSAAMSLVNQHQIDFSQNRHDRAAQTIEAFFVLGELEPNEQIGQLQTMRMQASHEDRRGQLHQSLLIYDRACDIAHRFWQRNPDDLKRWLILLHLQFQRGELVCRLPALVPVGEAFAVWRASFERFRQLAPDGTIANAVMRCQIFVAQVELALGVRQIEIARTLLGETRGEFADAQQRHPQSAELISLTLHRSSQLGQLSALVPLSVDEQAEREQGLHEARQHLQKHPEQSLLIRPLVDNLLFSAAGHIQRSEFDQAELRANEVLRLLTAANAHGMPVPELAPLLSEAHRFCAQALRDASRQPERRLHLESACRLATADQRSGRALELLRLHLEGADLDEARRVLDWIPLESPQRAEAQTLIDQAGPAPPAQED